MKEITVYIPITTASAKHYIPLNSACRLVSARVVTNVAEASGSLTVGKAGAAHTIKTASLVGAIAGTPVAATDTASVTDAEKATLFSRTVPLEVTVIGGTAGACVVVFVVDENAIGSDLGV